LTLDAPVTVGKGENHGLVKPANRKDYTVRMQELFDHHCAASRRRRS
jgi:hypothetical protein